MVESKKPGAKGSVKPDVARGAVGGSGVRAKAKPERTDASEHADTLRSATPASPRKQGKATGAVKKTTASGGGRGAAPAKKARVVARPLTRTATPRPARTERSEAPAEAQPKKVRESRPLPEVPQGHAALIGSSGIAKGETVALPEALTRTEHGTGVLFQAFNAARANARQGNAATKNRARVRGGGAKPWNQKGTGRARAGSTRSPLWRHGGVVFGPNGRTYWQRLPEKMRKSAFAEAFSDQASRGRVLVFDALPNGETPKTSAMRAWLDGIGDTGRTIVVADDTSEMAARAFANLSRVEVRSVGTLQLTDLLRCETLLVSRGALDPLALRAGGESTGGTDDDTKSAKPAVRRNVEEVTA